MITIGDIQRFAMEIGPLDPEHPQMRVVNIYVSGVNLCDFDNTAYVPQFITSIHRAADALKRKTDYAKYEPAFTEHSIEEAYHLLATDEGYLFHTCRVLDFGATTDNSLSFLIPQLGRLYLVSQVGLMDKDQQLPLAIAEITAYEIIQVLEQSRTILSTS